MTGTVELLRAQPHDHAAEQCVLGGMLLTPHAITAAAAELTADDFYSTLHATVFTTLVRLAGRDAPTDPVAVGATLLDSGDLVRIGGMEYLHTLVASVSTAANTGWYAKRVAGLGAKRRLVTAGTRIAELGYSTTVDPDEAVSRAQAAVHDATVRRQTSAARPIGELLSGALEEIEAAGKSTGTRGLSLGLIKADRLTGGMRPGQLWIVAGRPGMGKSVLGVDLVRHAAFRLGRPAALFSLEMSNQEVIERALSAETEVALDLVQSGKLTDRDWTKIARATARMAESPLVIDDSPDLTLAAIQAKARHLQQRGGLDIIVVDYLQLMTTDGKTESRQQEVSDISRGLKLLAKQLRCPVVAICQLNRGPEARADKRPALSDLRESGSLEQDADVVILLHRDDYYNKMAAKRGRVDLIFAKNRHGAQDTVEAAAQLWYSRIADLDLAVAS